MKKIVAIFFISVIGIHFFSCTVYAYNFVDSSSVQAKAFAGRASNEFMKFEVLDGFEELTDDLNPELADLFTFSHFDIHFRYAQCLVKNFANDHHTTQSIYLSNRVLLI